LSLPLAVKWAELETLRVDLFAAIQKSPTNEKLRVGYLATLRLQVAVERELGMGPRLATFARDEPPEWQQAHRRLLASMQRDALEEPTEE
jgi:hypothetical protein